MYQACTKEGCSGLDAGCILKGMKLGNHEEAMVSGKRKCVQPRVRSQDAVDRHYRSFHLRYDEMEEMMMWGVHPRRLLGHGFKPIESLR